MQPINSILTWVAIAVLFILFFTRGSGYVRGRMDLMDTAEMAALSPELKNIYRREIVSTILPSALRRVNTMWNSGTPAEKQSLIRQLRAGGEQLINNAPSMPAVPTGSTSRYAPY